MRRARPRSMTLADIGVSGKKLADRFARPPARLAEQRVEKPLSIGNRDTAVCGAAQGFFADVNLS